MERGTVHSVPSTKFHVAFTASFVSTSDTGVAALQQTVNILPPPHDLEFPIVKLLTHPIYHSYQSHIATLSLFSQVYLSYVPLALECTHATHTPGPGRRVKGEQARDQDVS
jgi:hypothetical protein